MSILVWTMMALAVWHFTIWLPDHFWGGIVGGFLAAIIGAIVFGFLVNGLSFPSRDETDVMQALWAVPGSALGLTVCYFYGKKLEKKDPTRQKPKAIEPDQSEL